MSLHSMQKPTLLEYATTWNFFVFPVTGCDIVVEYVCLTRLSVFFGLEPEGG